MTTMSCPSCGSPVLIRGDQWECGWCGNYGRLAPPEEAAPAPDPLDDVAHAVNTLREGMPDLPPEEAHRTAWSLAAYGMSQALCAPAARSRQNLRRLKAICRHAPCCTAEEVLTAAQRGRPLFADQFLLTPEALGTFWVQLLPKLPQYLPHHLWPQPVWLLTEGLSQVETFFTGQDADALADQFRRVFARHWQQFPLRHPDRDALTDAVRRWDFSENEWACRDLLVAAFPEAVRPWSRDELLEMDTMELVLHLARRDPATAIQMMRLLLDTAEDHLQEEAPAEHLLGWCFYDLLLDEKVLTLLIPQLEQDPRLARQLFGSAYVDLPQEEILDTCRRMGRTALAQTLQEILDQNPAASP